MSRIGDSVHDALLIQLETVQFDDRDKYISENFN